MVFKNPDASKLNWEYFCFTSMHYICPKKRFNSAWKEKADVLGSCVSIDHLIAQFDILKMKSLSSEKIIWFSMDEVVLGGFFGWITMCYFIKLQQKYFLRHTGHMTNNRILTLMETMKKKTGSDRMMFLNDSSCNIIIHMCFKLRFLFKRNTATAKLCFLTAGYLKVLRRFVMETQLLITRQNNFLGKLHLIPT